MLSPINTGIICEPESKKGIPAVRSSFLTKSTFSKNEDRISSFFFTCLMLSRLPAATAGHMDVVKINPFEKLLTKSIIVSVEAM